MGRLVAYNVRVVFEVPNDDPEEPEALELQLGAGTVYVVRYGGTAVEAEAHIAPTTDERELAIDAAVSLLPEDEVVAVQNELRGLSTGARAKRVRGVLVEKHLPSAGDPRIFVVYDGILPGPLMSLDDAAAKVLRVEQSRRMAR